MNMFSIIIPTYNEADQIVQTISKTHAANRTNEAEIIVVDGGSSDNTKALAKESGAIVIASEQQGRAAQMNKGAAIAKGEILYFLHADSIPPDNFTTQILDAYHRGAKSGCFRLAFDYNHWFLRANAWFTKFNLNAVRFGDQSLFVTKEVFQQTGGFREDLWVMEDQEIIHRLKKHGKFAVLNDVVITSARKYLDNGIYRMQGLFFRIWALYYLGYPQERLIGLHRKLIRQRDKLSGHD
ncbi:TIGR04283 family arsenosugar biosynthesis glycosyltransferase [Parapedobacter tibetensis]|uniref:TIGR04283 family arsenosugar biosynthesis glycosyltransferase n=1 Tax=Parapedobacter tibetensis TaxID=2972951 RepID=UPI00214D61B9|nr:TIGR04283 family arsenosugar biosynthesis glycosyltransferase [Parapedobacter tibetensis]